jgi:hypothetical protein
MSHSPVPEAGAARRLSPFCPNLFDRRLPVKPNYEKVKEKHKIELLTKNAAAAILTGVGGRAALTKK